MLVRTPFAVGGLTAILTILIDQVSKWWILEYIMTPPRRIPLVDFFALVLVHNRGASFGIFKDAPSWASWALIVFAILIAAALVIWMRRAETRFLAAALGLVAGGALGNVVDRIRFGSVIDFLDFHIGSWHWPAFNAADSAITVGVVLLVLDSLKSKPIKP